MATVPKSDRTTIITLASATAGPFDLTFRLFDDDRLAVFVNDIARTDFTISSNYVDGFDDNATISFDADLAVSDVVRVHSDMTAARGSDYQNGPGITEKLNIELARVWAVLSDLKRDAGRSFRVFEKISPISLVPNRTVVTNVEGDGFLFGPTVDEVKNAQTFAIVATEQAKIATDQAENAATAAADDTMLFLVSQDEISATFVTASRAIVTDPGPGPYPTISIEVI